MKNRIFSLIYFEQMIAAATMAANVAPYHPMTATDDGVNFFGRD
jgi:hypothetical protein